MINLTSIESPLATVGSQHAARMFARTFSPVALEIPMLFDHENAREIAEELCHRLLAQLGPRYSIKLLPWKLSVTEYPMLMDIVVREAIRSPFLLVTIDGESCLADDVKGLIRRCATAMSRSGGALVGQFYGITKEQLESLPACQCLQQIAEESNIPIFSTVVSLNQSRGAGCASPRRSGSPFVASLP